MSKLWEPIRIGTMELKNRFIMAPMFTCMAHPGGEVSDELVEYYERRARGGAAMIIVEIAAVHPRGVVADRELLLCDDGFIPGMARIAQAIKRHDCRAVLQLHHPGRQADSRVTGNETVGPSPVPWASFADVPRELSLTEVQELIERYAEAARRTRDAGFDGVEFHGAHGYLICQFFSPLSNQRTDEYGGDVYKRAKFGVDIVKLAREKLGREYPFLFRISGSEIDEGGLTTDETRIIAKLLQDAGVDCIDVSAGYYGSSEWVSQPPFMKPGCIVRYAKEIKPSVDVPVITVGKINTPRLAQRVLEDQAADIIALGRPLLADPDYPLKAKQGKEDEISKCIACNTCMDLVFLRKPIRCVQNPYAGYESEEGAEPEAANPCRALVIGEGPAALEAARVAALRGHDTVLWKTSEQPGGHWSWLIHGFVGEKLKAAAAAGATLQDQSHVSIDRVGELQPDVVLIENTARPVIPDIPGAQEENVVQAMDVLSGEREVSGRIVILGGGNTGVQTALHLGRRGAQITILEGRRGPAFEIEQISRKILVQKLADVGAETLFRCVATAIDADGVTYVDREEQQHRVQADHVVLALGMETESGLADSISGAGYRTIALEYCSSQRSVYSAVREGAVAARQV
jgi:2,4-dienoyl-CoA reductase-like NADH-dependent reductase (Old Yellow Enzyme family)/thioredoxin reductase